MFPDLSRNGSYADEAALLTASVGAIAALWGIYRQIHRNSRKIDAVVDTLNRVDEEPVPGETPSVGQRLVRIEKQVDTISESVFNLTNAMTSHILWEQKKSDRIEERLSDVEGTLSEVKACIEEQSGTKKAAAVEEPTPIKRTRRKRV